MPATQFAVIYSQLTGRVRSWVTFNGQNENDSLLSTVKPQQGEVVALFPMSQYGDLSAIQSLITQLTGKTPNNDRYAVVSQSLKDGNGNNLVLGFLIADPAGCGDALPNATLVAHPNATTGWSFSSQTFSLIAPVTTPVVALSAAQQSAADAGRTAKQSAAQIQAAVLAAATASVGS